MEARGTKTEGKAKDKISILMPVYNSAGYLSATLDSLMAQTYKNIEIICVDDGSTDKSHEILAKYAARDGRVKAIRQKNAGPAAARNAALDAASGKYIMFCDSDDKYEPQMCARMHQAITDKDCDLVICMAKFSMEGGFDAQYASMRNIDMINNAPAADILYDIRAIQTSQMLVLSNVLLWNKIFKKSIIKENGIRFPDGHEHDDDAFCYQYSFAAKNAYYLREPLYEYLVRKNSIMDNELNKRSKNRYDRLYILEFMHEFLKRRGTLGKDAYSFSSICAMQVSYMRHLFYEREFARIIGRINLMLAKTPMAIVRHRDLLVSVGWHNIATASRISPRIALKYAMETIRRKLRPSAMRPIEKSVADMDRLRRRIEKTKRPIIDLARARRA